MTVVRRPLIGVISDRRMAGPHPFHMVGEKYLRAIADASGGYPVGLPLLAGGFDVRIWPAVVLRQNRSELRQAIGCLVWIGYFLDQGPTFRAKRL